MWEQVLELMQMHPKERLRRVILTASWFVDVCPDYQMEYKYEDKYSILVE